MIEFNIDGTIKKEDPLKVNEDLIQRPSYLEITNHTLMDEWNKLSDVSSNLKITSGTIDPNTSPTAVNLLDAMLAEPAKALKELTDIHSGTAIVPKAIDLNQFPSDVNSLYNIHEEEPPDEKYMKIKALENRIEFLEDKMLKSETKPKRKTKTRMKKRKTKLNECIEAVEELAERYAEDVLPYTDDFKHLHRKNIEKGRDTTLD